MLKAALKNTFRLEEFRPGQLQVIEKIMSGQNALAIFPTGAGKSLLYQLPATLLEGLTVVISPLIALMQDQVQSLKALGVAAETWNSNTETGDLTAMKRDLKSGKLKLLFIAPEKVNNSVARELLLKTRISMLAVDEAHCVSSWGHAFRPDFLKLSRFAVEMKAERILCLTATATVPTRQDICREFVIPPANVVQLPFFRANLKLLVVPVSESELEAKLLEILRQERARPDVGPAIVYVTTQKTSERLMTMLTKDGVCSRAYHGGMEGEERTETQKWFSREEQPVIVATIAFGMGIDVRNIRTVIHFNQSKSVEGYGQEIGRAGRDGRESRCITLFCPSADSPILESFAYVPTPTLKSCRELVRSVFEGNAVGSIIQVPPYEQMIRLDANRTTVDILFAYLDVFGSYILEQTPTFKSASWKLANDGALKQAVATSDRIAALINGRAERKKTLAHLDLSQFPFRENTKNGEASREDVLGALFQMKLDHKVEGVLTRFKILRQPDDMDSLASSLFQRMEAREQQDLAGTERLTNLLKDKSCIWVSLAAYFGDTIGKCTTACQVCLHGQIRMFGVMPEEEAIKQQVFQSLVARVEKGPLPAQPNPDLARMLAKFLVGFNSPGMPSVFGMSAKAIKEDPLFGLLVRICFWI